ncbi:MAG TPA: hypothetical protein VJU13_01345 [Candidatus Nitrosocosmicus sp.]|nr:hypothetical protein [Candidatus Nitrosocosmicus sp.]
MKLHEKYKLIIEKESVNHVKVLKSEGYINHWNFLLNGDNEKIVFSEFYTETKFIVMNWEGWIRVYDAETKTKIIEIKLQGKINTQAVLSLDKSLLYVVMSNESSQTILSVISLDTFTVSSRVLLDIYGSHLAIRKDGNLLFYKMSHKYIKEKKIFIHFFSVLNMKSYTVEQFEIPFAPQYSINDFEPVIDIENNRCIMPSYDEILTKTTDLGETVFEFRIVLFDLDTFRTISVLSVRDFTDTEIDFRQQYENKEMKRLLLGSKEGEDYWKAINSFYENLKKIRVAPDGFWLFWHDGFTRKINTDLSISTLLVPA